MSNPTKPFEAIVGDNRATIRFRLGNLHVAHSYYVAFRYVRPKNMRSMSVAIRRGWVQCVADTWKEYRSTYETLMQVKLYP